MSKYSPSELQAKAFLVASGVAGLMTSEELEASLEDINQPKKEAIAAGEIPSSYLPSMFEVIADVVEEVACAVLDSISNIEFPDIDLDL